MNFYAALGFTINLEFSDNAEKYMVWSENIFLMLLTYEKFKNFGKKPIVNTKSNLAGLFLLSLYNIEEMNNLMTYSLKAGGNEPTEMKDYGFMQQRTIEDFESHTWKSFIWTLQNF